MSVTHTSTIPQTLGQVRDLLVRTSGRYNLVNPDGTDNGFNEYIHRGIKYLAELFPRTTNWINDISAGATRVALTDNQAVLDVWMTNSTWGKLRLRKLPLMEFREEYSGYMKNLETSAQPPIVSSAVASGRPVHYAIAQSGLAPEQNFPDSDDWAAGDNVTDDYEDITPGDYYATKIILFAPIPDETFTIRVFGHFYPKKLTADSQMNFWTMNHSDLVVKAAQYMVECDHRNSAGQNDTYQALMRALQGLWYNEVHEEMAGIDRIALSP